MFLKRFMVMAAGVVLFIVVFIVYFEVSSSQMEGRFRAEREKFGVQGVVLTATEPDVAPSAPAATNNPVPPPDNTPAPSTSPPTPDSNSAPVAPAPSTWNEPRAQHSPYFVRASYRPSDGADIPFIGLLAGAVASPSPTDAASPATNAISTKTATTAIAPEPATPETSPTVPANKPAAHPTMEGSVIVLLYHQFKAPGVPIPAKFQWTLNQDLFASEMKYIHDNGYHVVSLADVLRFLKHEITLPPQSVCITIDDGYKSAIVYAAPILKQYGYPWTFYIYPEFITVGEGPGAASWNDLLALQAQGVDIECHSMTHPKLTSRHQLIKGVWHNFTPEEYDAWLNNEIVASKAILEQKMGKPITSFAYPFGAYNTQVEAKAIAAGYETILTVAGNPIHSTTDPHSIGRYTITQSEVKYFVSDLHQGALGLGDPEPAPGTTTGNPRPVISAVLGYPGTLDPKSIDTTVYGFDVRHDFDPKTSTVRLYLPRDLIQQVVPVDIRVKDATTGQVMVARWHFDYVPSGGATASHPPIASATNTAPARPQPQAQAIVPASASPHPSTAPIAAVTNAPTTTDTVPTATNTTDATLKVIPPSH